MALFFQEKDHPNGVAFDRYVIKASRYECDGVSIEREGEDPFVPDSGSYRLSLYEKHGNGGIFDPFNIDGYTDHAEGSYKVGPRLFVYLTDEEMEELFMAYQALKNGVTPNVE